MKIKLNIIALLGAVLLVSCGKDLELIQDESNQNNIAKEIEANSIFHKSYDGDLTIDEVKALWKKDLEEFNKSASRLKSAVNNFEFEVVTKTSDIKYAGTDDKVTCQIRFMADGSEIACLVC